jgi:hypothetical protein
MRTAELPGGVTVRTFSTPPDGFDPVQADDRALLAYGYPSRPEDPELLERWERVLSGPIRFIEPAFGSMPSRRRRLPTARTRSVHDHAVQDTIWSGAVVHPGDGDSFKWIEGEWTVPNAYLPAGALKGRWYFASTWIGIDGFYGPDVLQAGCDSSVMRTSAGAIQRQLSPWWEWYPADTISITNLPIAQGDTLDGLICMDAGSVTSAMIFLLNVTSGVAARFGATAPPGTSLAGNSAEWVVERLEEITHPHMPELARYGDVYFDAANTGTMANKLLNAGAGSVINMVDSGETISTGRIETPTLVQVRYTSPK